MGNLPKPTSTVGTASKLLLAVVAKSKPEDISDWLATGPLKGGRWGVAGWMGAAIGGFHV